MKRHHAKSRKIRLAGHILTLFVALGIWWVIIESLPLYLLY